MAKFVDFFNTDIGAKAVTLVGKKQQKHEIILKDEVEYFALDEKIKPCLPYINGIKSCDYVLVNHTNKEILLCELKNYKKGGFIPQAEEQLKHSKYIIEFFLKILNKQDYKYASLILCTRKMNKNHTGNSKFKPKVTHKKSINWTELKYA